MPLQSYTDLTAALGNWLQRSDLAALLPNFVQLFEACANRRLRVRQQEATVMLTPQAVVTVTGAAASPAGLVRLALASTAALSNGDQVAVAGILGTLEANGLFPIAVVDATHVDLIGSLFVNAYAGGGTLTDTGNVPLPGDYLAWRRVTWMGNPLRELSYVHPSTLTSHYPDVPIDLPSEFTIEGGTLRVMPQDPTPLTLLYYQQIPSARRQLHQLADEPASRSLPVRRAHRGAGLHGQRRDRRAVEGAPRRAVRRNREAQQQDPRPRRHPHHEPDAVGCLLVPGAAQHEREARNDALQTRDRPKF